MMVNITNIFLILISFQVTGIYGKKKVAGWKEDSYKEQKSKGIENPNMSSLEQYAVYKACPWKKPFVKYKRAIRCKQNAECPNAFYCQKVKDPYTGKGRVHHNVCCRYPDFPCENPAEYLTARSSRNYVSCKETNDCPRLHTCNVTHQYSLCCPVQLVIPAIFEDDNRGSDATQYIEGCSFNGNMVEDGYRSEDIKTCTTCKCKRQQMVCKTRKNCMCQHKGFTYGNMEQFLDGDCFTCTCKHGKVTCREDRCMECQIEKYGTLNHMQSEYFDDTCQQCKCMNGDLTCTDDPACTCEDGGIKYAHNTEFTREDDCIECKCRHGNVHCEPANRCSCKHDGKLMQHGGNMVDFDGCTICYCNNQSVSCPERAECKTCIEGEREYKSGQSYMTSDRCRWCVCISRKKSECRVISRNPRCEE